MELIIFVEVNEEGTVVGYGSSSITDGDIEIEIDSNHEFFDGNLEHFKLLDGVLMKKSEQEINDILERAIPPSEAERIEQLENMILQLLMTKGGDL